MCVVCESECVCECVCENFLLVCEEPGVHVPCRLLRAFAAANGLEQLISESRLSGGREAGLRDTAGERVSLALEKEAETKMHQI